MPIRRDAVLTAHATLSRGTTFLSTLADGSALDSPWPEGRQGIIRSRVFANSLAELDRFLHVMMDAVGAPGTREGEPDRHNAALKLGRVADGLARLNGRQHRLRALGRSRASFVHLAGIARRADRPDQQWMTAGWSDAATGRLRRYRIGERLAPVGADLTDVCGFYDRLADDLLLLARDR